MFNIDDILAELAAGKSIEQVAQNAADVLNAAKAQYDKEQAAKAKAEAERKAKEEAERKAAIQKKRKMNSATAIMNSIFDYMDEFHPGFFSDQELADFHRTFDAGAFVDAIDETVKMIKEMPTVAKALADAGDSKNVSVKLSPDEAKELESALDKFLKENNLF
jgi:hypothetical protein